MSAGDDPYRIEFQNAARRRLAKLDKNKQRRINIMIGKLAEDPRPPGAKKLTDAGGLHRVRVGDFRVIYAVDDEARVVTIADVRGRDDIYRKRE
jgi:mRNA interferase RelE/StbE